MFLSSIYFTSLLFDLNVKCSKIVNSVASLFTGSLQGGVIPALSSLLVINFKSPTRTELTTEPLCTALN